jgi:hypothetical protein
MSADFIDKASSGRTAANGSHSIKGRQRAQSVPKETSQSTSERLAAHLGDALANLGDRAVLNGSPLSRVAYIQDLALEKYADKLMARGLALRHVILDCIARLRGELGSEPGLSRCCRYLELRSQGVKCRQISKELNVSREHASRVVRKQALQLLTEAFLTVTRNGNQPR